MVSIPVVTPNGTNNNITSININNVSNTTNNKTYFRPQELVPSARPQSNLNTISNNEKQTSGERSNQNEQLFSLQKPIAPNDRVLTGISLNTNKISIKKLPINNSPIVSPRLQNNNNSSNDVDLVNGDNIGYSEGSNDALINVINENSKQQLIPVVNSTIATTTNNFLTTHKSSTLTTTLTTTEQLNGIVHRTSSPISTSSPSMPSSNSSNNQKLKSWSVLNTNSSNNYYNKIPIEREATSTPINNNNDIKNNNCNNKLNREKTLSPENRPNNMLNNWKSTPITTPIPEQEKQIIIIDNTITTNNNNQRKNHATDELPQLPEGNTSTPRYKTKSNGFPNQGKLLDAVVAASSLRESTKNSNFTVLLTDNKKLNGGHLHKIKQLPHVNLGYINDHDEIKRTFSNEDIFGNKKHLNRKNSLEDTFSSTLSTTSISSTSSLRTQKKTRSTKTKSPNLNENTKNNNNNNIINNRSTPKEFGKILSGLNDAKLSEAKFNSKSSIYTTDSNLNTIFNNNTNKIKSRNSTENLLLTNNNDNDKLIERPPGRLTYYDSESNTFSEGLLMNGLLNSRKNFLNKKFNKGKLKFIQKYLGLDFKSLHSQTSFIRLISGHLITCHLKVKLQFIL